MRQYLIITAIAVLFVTALSAQKVKVDISNKSIGGGRHDAFVTVIYSSKASDVKKEWKALMKSYVPEKIKGGSEIMADNARISSISTNTIDIYAKIDQQGNDVELIVGFDLGGAYVDGSHSGSRTAKNIVYDFAVKMTTIGIEAEVKTAEKVLASKEKDLEKLKKSNDRLHQNIEKWKQEIETAKSDIEQAEKDLETNKSDQESAEKGIEDQKKTVGQVADKLKRIR